MSDNCMIVTFVVKMGSRFKPLNVYILFCSYSPPTPPPLETSRTFSIFILQVLRLSVVYKSIKAHLGQSQKLIMSIHIYLKCKYTYENAGICTLCIDDFKILKFLSNYRGT